MHGPRAPVNYGCRLAGSRPRGRSGREKVYCVGKTAVRQTATMSNTFANNEPGPAEYAAMRQVMVQSQLRTTGVNDPRVVAAMADVPRERFLPATVRAFAYSDRRLPLGGARFQNASEATGKLLTELYLRPDDQVLLIGAAGGYTAAVLASLVASVVAVESDPALAAAAEAALAGTTNVRVRHAPLTEGAPDDGPYDVILIDGAVEQIPQPLLAQLKPLGRVATGMLDHGVSRLAVGRRSPGGFGVATFADVDCVPLPGFERARAFTF
jgi:protein-L-isoaspartate(D-aspartate) O-methyltransferase